MTSATRLWAEAGNGASNKQSDTTKAIRIITLPCVAPQPHQSRPIPCQAIKQHPRPPFDVKPLWVTGGVEPDIARGPDRDDGWPTIRST
jgi:hypothetical protein